MISESEKREKGILNGPSRRLLMLFTLDVLEHLCQFVGILVRLTCG